MPCHHKFINDLQLQYVDWEVNTLFIGTFNPGWESCDNNYAQWFYGRVQRNKFWCILPACHNQPALINGNRGIWIDFCSEHRIAITDIVEKLANADEFNPGHRNLICNFKDEYLNQFGVVLNNIPAILEANPAINRICITRATMNAVLNEWFAPTRAWMMANPQRQIQWLQLRSPSQGARRGVVGPFCEFVKNQWLAAGY